MTAAFLLMLGVAIGVGLSLFVNALASLVDRDVQQ